VMIAAFLWGRVGRRWRPLLAGYVVIMAFTLVYSAEHYVIDLLLGWALAAMTTLGVRRYERRRLGAARPPGEGEWPSDDTELGEDILDARRGHLGSPLRQASGQL
jgi:membrane-associated phospholipid phosphatase